MSESTGYGESPDTADAEEDLVDGRTGDNRSDGSERDVTLTTDDDAQDDDSVVRSGNSSG
ncbi:hypothetical protein GB931_12850 [Modestobacter sp. I12A-02628]|uniref:Uncharacterized protein n=1 Tax=Goekera deserti TaxID=2497753 RepID=A0A7K3W9U0_9ACTN|nr:hypothetical protein [Goekera deserti]MPQ98792.1 hypothetical protein [Goekera deserti]NDI49710.1 hypothetical protein [Goekera deserti]NEL53097.1 hypothetical protein [Goekera deserti]